MAVNTNKDEEPEAPAALLRPVEEPIFGGEAKTLTVTKEVGIHQLVDEVDEKLGDRDRFHVVAHLEDDQNPISETNPLTLYVHGDADMRIVRGVVESHVKDEHYGLTDEEKDINELKARLKAGEDLPAAELNRLLRSIL
jgi:hypothetical protein